MHLPWDLAKVGKKGINHQRVSGRVWGGAIILVVASKIKKSGHFFPAGKNKRPIRKSANGKVK